MPRSVRGRPSQVKGAFGVADAMALRATLDLGASTAPVGRIAGRPGACPVHARHPSRPPLVWADDVTLVISELHQSSRSLVVFVVVVAPGGVFVVAGSGFQAAVQDADQPVAQLAECGVVAGAAGPEFVVVGPGTW